MRGQENNKCTTKTEVMKDGTDTVICPDSEEEHFPNQENRIETSMTYFGFIDRRVKIGHGHKGRTASEAARLRLLR